MPLILKIIAPSQLISGQTTEYKFDELGGTLGRKPSNDFILLDPERFISSKHATIECKNNQYFITDTSTNGVFINNSATPLGTGNSAELKDGDKITIGDFKLACHLEHTSNIGVSLGLNTDLPTPSVGSGVNSINEIETSFIENSDFDIGNPYEEPATLQPDFDPDIVDPLAILGGELGGEPVKENAFDSANFSPIDTPPSLNDNLGDHLFNNPHETIPEPSVINEPFTPPSVIPDDWDILGESNPADPLITPTASDPIPPGESFSAIPSDEKIFDDDDIFSSLNNADSSAVDNFLSPQSSPSQRVTSNQGAKPNHRPNPTPASPFPQTPQAPQTPIRQAPQMESQAFAMEGNDLLDSFLKGAGINGDQLSNQDKKALMHKVGLLTRSSVEGLMIALRARSTIKSSFRVNKTSIAPIENNPLKFLVTTDDALITLLSDDKQGYMPAEDAFNEGFKDLQTHQMALMAGMQATIKAIVTQFDPSNLEHTFDNQGGSSIIPGQKKSKNWDSYVEFHARISNRLLDDFQHVYGEEFAHAYEAQINKLL